MSVSLLFVASLIDGGIGPCKSNGGLGCTLVNRLVKKDLKAFPMDNLSVNQWLLSFRMRDMQL